jgi:tryptophan synthase alpha chain
MNLTHPRLIGFGISDAATFQLASRYCQGAIIGSAFIKSIKNSNDLNRDINSFIQGVIG